MKPDPIYLNWEFWTAIVAVLALVLSQIPPLYQLFGTAKLSMEVYPRIGIGHKVGYPNMQVGIVLSNSGSRPAKVRRILITILREGTVVATLPAQMYAPESEPSKQLLFAGFKIKPNEDRTHSINFFMDLQRNQERELSEPTLIIMNDIVAKRSKQENKDVLVEADPVNVQPFHQMLLKNFLWLEGEYSMSIRVESSDAKVFTVKRFRFTLYESDSSQLRNYESRYKYGEGIYYGLEKQWIWIRISEG
jgi:hypothetical protein